MELLFVLIVPLILFGFTLSLSRLLNCLIALENFNVYLIMTVLYLQYSGVGGVFVSLLVIVTIEITLGLLSLTRLICNSSESWNDSLW